MPSREPTPKQIMGVLRSVLMRTDGPLGGVCEWLIRRGFERGMDGASFPSYVEGWSAARCRPYKLGHRVGAFLRASHGPEADDD